MPLLTSDSEDFVYVDNCMYIEDGNSDIGDPNSIKYSYHDGTWNQNYCAYDPEPPYFIEVWEYNFVGRQFLAMLQLFESCWPCSILHDIVVETNWYATKIDAKRNNMDGLQWEELTRIDAIWQHSYIWAWNDLHISRGISTKKVQFTIVQLLLKSGV